MRRKFREEERDKRKREERKDGDGDGGGAVGVGDGPRKLRCGHSTVNRCKLRYSVQSPASPGSCDCLYNHVDVTPTACRFRSEVACRCLHLPIRLVFLVFFLLYSTRQTPRCFKVAVVEEQAIEFLQLFCLICLFFLVFLLVHLAAAVAASLSPCLRTLGYSVSSAPARYVTLIHFGALQGGKVSVNIG